MPRTHAGLLGQILDGERRIEMLARPAEQRCEAAAWRLKFQQRRELRLAAAAAVLKHQPAPGVLPALGAPIPPHPRPRRIDAGGATPPKSQIVLPRAKSGAVRA